MVGNHIGEFKYQENVLLNAYKQGKSLVLENYQEATQDVIQ